MILSLVPELLDNLLWNAQGHLCRSRFEGRKGSAKDHLLGFTSLEFLLISLPESLVATFLCCLWSNPSGGGLDH